jgi:hypothetical protein
VWFLLAVLKIKQGIQLSFREYAEALENLSQPFSAAFLLGNYLIELFAGDMARVYEQFSEQLSFPGRESHCIVYVSKVPLYYQRKFDVPGREYTHPDQYLAQEFFGPSLFNQGMVQILL